MFYGFLVKPEHRDYLRFLWHKDGDLSKAIQEYRMRVHIFDNSPSPAVALYGLHRAVQKNETKYGADTKQFVYRHFYVDDGLVSMPTEAAAIDLLKRTCASLAESNLKLHAIASNSIVVMRAFKPEELATGIRDLGLDDEALPTQRSLGLCWDINTNMFTFKVDVADKPYTRRGVLSVVNSIFDPLRLAAPVTIKGKLLLRELSNGVQDWDTPLPDENVSMWETWKSSLEELSSLRMPRCYVPMSLSKPNYTELCLFSDASNWAIRAVASIRMVAAESQCEVGFVMAKTKLSPRPEPTIPRLELCGAVLAVELAELILDKLDHKPDTVKFYCDSKVVLGYIFNDSKRFFVYVHNRVHRIHQTSPEQWHYVPPEQNPADLATRSVAASHLMDTRWFKGPEFRHKPSKPDMHEQFELIEPDKDVNIRTEVNVLATRIEAKVLTSERFQRFSTWKALVRAISFLIHQLRSHKSTSTLEASRLGCTGWHSCSKPRTPEELAAARRLIIETVQRDSFPEKHAALQAKREIPNSSPLLTLDPYVSEGLLNVGGRLENCSLDSNVKHPVIIPKNSHVAKLLVAHYHMQVKHQG